MSERAGVRSFTTICLPSRARVPPASPSANRPFLGDVKTLRQRTGDGDVLDSSRPSREDFTMISEWSARFGTPPSTERHLISRQVRRSRVCFAHALWLWCARVVRAARVRRWAWGAACAADVRASTADVEYVRRTLIAPLTHNLMAGLRCAWRLSTRPTSCSCSSVGRPEASVRSLPTWRKYMEFCLTGSIRRTRSAWRCVQWASRRWRRPPARSAAPRPRQGQRDRSRRSRAPLARRPRPRRLLRSQRPRSAAARQRLL